MKYVLQCTSGVFSGTFLTKEGSCHHELAMAEVFESLADIYSRRQNHVCNPNWCVKELKVDAVCATGSFGQRLSQVLNTTIGDINKTKAQLLQEKLLKNKEERIKAHREAYERQVKWETDVLETLKQLVEIHKTLKRTPTKKRSK